MFLIHLEDVLLLVELRVTVGSGFPHQGLLGTPVRGQVASVDHVEEDEGDEDVHGRGELRIELSVLEVL